MFQAVSLRHFATWLSAQLQSPGNPTGSSFESFLDVPDASISATRIDSTPDHLVVVQAVASELSAFFADPLNPVHPKAQSKVYCSHSRIDTCTRSLESIFSSFFVSVPPPSRCRSPKDSISIHGSTNPSPSPRQLRMTSTLMALTFLGRFSQLIDSLQSGLVTSHLCAL